MKKITFKSNYNFDFDESYFNYETQLSIISKLFFNIDFNLKDKITSIIKNKLNSYIQQDKKQKRKYDNNITYEETIEKLLISKLNCYYCKKNVLLLYKMIKDKSQWTLERIDNSINHSNNNVVICCLECNIKRGRKKSEQFLLGKQFKIVKTI